MPSLKEIVRERILQDTIRAVKTTSGWKILVLDHVTLRIISAACRMYDIMEEGVTLVEKIDETGQIKRQPLPQMDAIYILTPTVKSVDALIEDYKNPSKPQYGDVHLFFSSKLPDSLLQRIKGAAVVSRVKTIKEIYLEFLATESSERGSTFLLDPPDPLRFGPSPPDSLRVLFSPDYAGKRDLELEKDRIANQLMSLCATLGEYPLVRFANASTLSRSLATKIQDKLDHAKKSGILQVTSSPQGTLLVVDRSIDPLAPLLHEFTYQAMCYDLLDIQGDKFSYDYVNNAGASTKKDVVIGEQDLLWPSLRYLHIAECIDEVIKSFNDFLKTNKATKLTPSGGGVKDLSEMSSAVRDMPQFRELLSKYSLHIHLAQECMKAFKSRNLEKIAALEQDMATGEDSEGNQVKSIMANVLPVLSDPQINHLDKLRLLLIYVITQEGIKDADRQRLFRAAGLKSDDEQTVMNLSYLAVALAQGAKGMRTALLGKKAKKSKKRKDDVAYDLSRYSPVLKSILEELLKDELSPANFPYAKDPALAAASTSTADAASMRRQPASKSRWAMGRGKAKDETVSGPRVIVFMAGGTTYSETRTCHELASSGKREICIGSTHVFTPESYLVSLRGLKLLPGPHADEE